MELHDNAPWSDPTSEEAPLTSSGAGTPQRARQILAQNWCGTYTKPARDLYPHQWNWDSGFIALAHAHSDPDRAWGELNSLFRAQWTTGLLPHIVFNPSETEYFPDPEFWDVQRSAHAPRDILSSGITQPPLHGVIALELYKRLGERAVGPLKDLFPKLVAQHRHLYHHRDPEREGLACIIHPWESGTDNSPAWDEPLGRIDPALLESVAYQRKDLDVVAGEHRPTKSDYDHYVYLVEVCKGANYDEATVMAESPFVIQDPLFNSLLCRANEDLIEVAEILHQDASELREWHAQTKHAIDTKLWSEERGLYTYYDLRAGKALGVDSISGFLPLVAGVPDATRAARLLTRLESPGFAGRRTDCFTVPSYDMESPAFDPGRYWRGPVWINIDWLLYHGLRRYGFDERARAVREDALALVDRFGFHEYYSPYRDPAQGPIGGAGSPDFSWTAALYLDLLAQEGGRSETADTDRDPSG